MERALYTYGLIAMSAAIALAGYEWINWRCLTTGDWAAWVGAVGTIAAFAGTIWIATGEKRDRMRRERSKAYIQAHLAAIQLAELRKRYKSYVEALQNAKDKQRAFEIISEHLKEAYIFNIDDLCDLICLRENISRDFSILLSIHQTAIFKLGVGRHLKNDTDSINKEINGVIEVLNLGAATAENLSKRLKSYIDSRIDNDES